MNSSNNSKKPNSYFRGRGKQWRGRGNYHGRGGQYNRKNQNNTHTGNGDESTITITLPTKDKNETNQIPITSFYDQVPGSYKAWKLYHPMEEYNTSSHTVSKIKAMEKYIDNHRDIYTLTDIEERKCYNLDLKMLISDKDFLENWKDFINDLSNNPDHTLNCLSLAMHQFLLTELERECILSEEKSSEICLPIIRVRILNFEPIIQMKNLTANTYGQLVSVQGTVIRVGNVKLLSTWLAFSCVKCDSVQCVPQPEGAYTLPTSCTGQSCHSRTFKPLYSSPYTQTVNWQTVRIQEIIANNQSDGGRVPRTVECELVEELVDSCLPGDVVTVTGIVKIRGSDENSGRKNKSSSVYIIYIEGKSVVNNKRYTVGGRTKQNVDVEFTTDDYYKIQEIHSQPNLFRLLVNSLCPAIFGHEMVKAGLLLGLFGGAQGGPSRGDSHILVVGDPGLGKSQMLQACSAVAPRGVYVCGNTSTSSGLTVTLTREGGGNYALEAGALVLADQGCCCIDEFDKMSSQHQALLEAMEQQVISISKAGVICTLPARTSVLAAANPVSGHYNRVKTVAENLRLGSALLSRFDLVFILQDQPNEHLDNLLSEHVMALYSGLKPTSSAASLTASTSTCNQDTEVSLSERLRPNPCENLDFIPQTILRKYIAYARKYVPSPQLSEGAEKVLQNFYLDLRKQHQTLDSTPITTRQLESLIRLTQARAKIELREEATALDAIEVVELMRWSMVDTYADGFGGLDFRRSQHGSGMSSKSKAKKFVHALQRQAEVKGNSLFSVDDMKNVANINRIMVNDFFTFVSSLNDHGFILKKGKNLYQLMSVDY